MLFHNQQNGPCWLVFITWNKKGDNSWSLGIPRGRGEWEKELTRENTLCVWTELKHLRQCQDESREGVSQEGTAKIYSTKRVWTIFVDFEDGRREPGNPMSVDF